MSSFIHGRCLSEELYGKVFDYEFSVPYSMQLLIESDEYSKCHEVRDSLQTRPKSTDFDSVEG